jgi:hypothetical protein
MPRNPKDIKALDVFAELSRSYIYVLPNVITRVPTGVRWVYNTPTKDTFIVDTKLRDSGIECAGLDFIRGQQSYVCLYHTGKDYKLIDGQRLGRFPRSFLVRREVACY